MVAYIVMAVIAYLIGSVNFSVIISKKMAGFDVREKGSGNAGSTNVLRTVGKKAAIITLICDILKGVVSVLIALLVGWITGESANSAIVVEIAALAVVIGHTFPIFFGFRGGKGVATSLGVILIVNWKIGLICLVFALALMALTRMVSLGSISAAVLFAVLTIFIRDSYIGGIDFDFSFIIFGILLAALVIFNHRSNLKRIINGTENKLNFKKKETKNDSEEKTENVETLENKVETVENNNVEKENSEEVKYK
ncbi:MAG: glycerol-3-phosphate 1-O-acyltransferase PlsY [Clostridia bacterium]|nr:glycerol-3-phosphate 1-O-acyltransferase PlsY [Clostridia bacterium]